MNFGQRLKEIRKTECVTQKQMAFKLKMIEQDYQKYEYNKVKPGLDKINEICKIFPNYVLYLMTGKTEPPGQISPDLKSERDIAAKQNAG